MEGHGRSWKVMEGLSYPNTRSVNWRKSQEKSGKVRKGQERSGKVKKGQERSG